MTERHGYLAQIRNRAIARHHAATRSGRLNSPVLKASTILLGANIRPVPVTWDDRCGHGA